MKSDPTLTKNTRLLLDGVEYDRYSIDAIEWKLTSNILNVKVDYANLTQSKYTSRAWPVEAGAEVNVNQVIETIHQLHEKLKA
jgi:hypothetical protein